MKCYLRIIAGLLDTCVKKYFITQEEAHHPVLKDTLMRCLKELMHFTDIDITVTEPGSTRGVPNSIAFELIMPLAELLKQGKCSNALTFLRYYFRGTEADELQESEETEYIDFAFLYCLIFVIFVLYLKIGFCQNIFLSL